jgi:hypothetical protein
MGSEVQRFKGFGLLLLTDITTGSQRQKSLTSKPETLNLLNKKAGPPPAPPFYA